MNKKLLTLGLATTLFINCSKSGKNNGASSENPLFSENQPAAVVPENYKNEGVYGAWKPKLNLALTLMSKIASVDYTMFVLEDKIIIQQKCIDSGLIASVESSAVITDKYIEALNDDFHEVKSLKSTDSCSLDSKAGKTTYSLSKDKNTLILYKPDGKKETLTRVI